eukprot:s3355_g7.t1
MAAPPVLAIDAFCTHAADAKAKAPLRHVLIRDLAKVAAAMKQPLATKEASALLQAFDGEPGAAELCAKQMHLKLLRRLAKASSTAEISKALQGAVLDLDADLRQQRPGVPGCSGVIALFVGCRLYVVVAGSCVGNIWGKGLSELAFAPAASEIGKDGVLRKSSKESPEQKRAKALLRLKARNPHQLIGGSVSLPGGRRPGSEAVAARGAAAVRASAAAAMGKGATALSAEDLLTEVVDLRAGDHTSILLGSSGLANSGLTPQDIGTLAEACEDATKASMTIAELAKERLKEAVKGEANWVQQEKSKASEVTCLAVKLDWDREPAGHQEISAEARADQVGTLANRMPRGSARRGTHEHEKEVQHCVRQNTACASLDGGLAHCRTGCVGRDAAGHSLICFRRRQSGSLPRPSFSYIQLSNQPGRSLLQEA